MTRWAFLDTETGDWIEVKPGTVVPAALSPEWHAELATVEAEARTAALDDAIALVQQSLDTVRGEDDGVSRTVRVSIAAREHVILLLAALRDAKP